MTCGRITNHPRTSGLQTERGHLGSSHTGSRGSPRLQIHSGGWAVPSGRFPPSPKRAGRGVGWDCCQDHSCTATLCGLGFFVAQRVGEQESPEERSPVSSHGTSGPSSQASLSRRKKPRPPALSRQSVNLTSSRRLRGGRARSHRGKCHASTSKGFSDKRVTQRDEWQHSSRWKREHRVKTGFWSEHFLLFSKPNTKCTARADTTKFGQSCRILINTACRAAMTKVSEQTPQDKTYLPFLF